MKPALLIVALVLSLLIIPQVWAADACSGQKRELSASQRKLAAVGRALLKANGRVDKARLNVGKALRAGSALVLKADLRARNAETLSTTVAAVCERLGRVERFPRQPARVTFRGRRYVCSVGSLASLARGAEFAKSALTRATSRAEFLNKTAHNFLARMQQRAKRYQDEHVLAVAARDNWRAELQACLGIQQPIPNPGAGDTKPLDPSPAEQPNPVPLRDLASHIFSSFIALAKEEGETSLISRYVHPFKWTRNINVWTNSLDLTGLAVNINGLGGVGGGTLITRKHILLSNHVPYPELPATIHFVDGNSTYAEYKIIKVRQVSETDMKIGELDREVDPSFKVYKVLPSNFRSWLPGKFHVLFSDFEKKALIGELIQLHKLIDGVACEVAESANDVLSRYFERPTGGDSGNPVFTLINGEPVLIGGWSRLWGARTAVATFIPDHYDALNETIWSLSPGYQAQQADLSIFDTAAPVTSR
jgi:hypothetical protein